MKGTIKWLIKIEKLAHLFYTQATDLFSDPSTKAFLKHCAEDEARHYNFMVRALEVVGDHPDLLSAISLDDEIKRKIENSFKRNLHKLNSHSLTVELLMDGIIETELSEWNHIFTYVVRSLKGHTQEFKSAAAGIQHHLRHMVHFLESHPYGKVKIDALKELSPVWEENILIVDDSPAILDLLTAILINEGHIVTAENGEVGLEKIRTAYYKLIISDIEMPVMNGMDLYRKASSEFPGMRDRFVFLTGNPTSETLDFFRKYQLNFLTKPATVKQIKAVLLQSMHDISVAG